MSYVKVFSREYSLSRMEQVMLALCSPVARRLFGLPFRGVFVVKEGVNSTIFQDERERDARQEYLYKIACTTAHGFNAFNQLYRRAGRNLLTFARKVHRLPLTRYSNHELLLLYQRYSTVHLSHMSIAQWPLTQFPEILPEKVERELHSVSITARGQEQ